MVIVEETKWRPPQDIRPISIALIRRGDELLVMAVKDDAGRIKGWRPPGGAIEFGESAQAAIEREIFEELGDRIPCQEQVCVLENIYTHEGAQGHEIVFVFEAALPDSAAHLAESYKFQDGGVDNLVVWRKVEEFLTGAERLFPEQLVNYLV